MSIFQTLDCLIEIFYFQGRARSLLRWFPLIRKIAKRQRAVADRIFNPGAARHFLRRFQPEHAFIKFSRALHVRHWNPDKCDRLNFHFEIIGESFTWDLELAAAPAFCAAPARSSAAIKARPLCSSNFFPASTFVPSRRTTSGTPSF